MEAAATSRALTDEFVREWGERFLAGWNSHDPDRLAALATEDVRWEDPLIHPNGVLHGRAELRAWLESVWRAMPDLEFRIESQPLISLDRTTLAAAWVGEARMTGALDPPGFAPTGGHVKMRGVDLHSFEDDLVAHVVTVTDTTEIARQIGAAPPPDSGVERIGVRFQRLTARRLRKKAG